MAKHLETGEWGEQMAMEYLVNKAINSVKKLAI
jgi:hypothetical protein